MLSSLPFLTEKSRDSSLPTSFEDFVQREQRLLQNNDKEAVVVTQAKKDAAAAKPIPGEKLKKTTSKDSSKRPKKKTKTSNAMREALAVTMDKSSMAAVKKNEPTEEEVNAAMPADVPTGNSKEDRKKRRLIRNRVSAQLHRERKKKYISSLENKVKEQSDQIGRMRAVIESLTVENQKLRQMSAKNQCASCASSGSDSSLSYSPSLSEGTDDDVEEDVSIPSSGAFESSQEMIKRNPSMEVEEMGDVMEYADTLFDGVELTEDTPDFDLGLWPETDDSIVDGIELETPKGGSQNKRKFSFLFGVFFMTALFGSSLIAGQSSQRVLMLDHQPSGPSSVEAKQPMASTSHVIPSGRRRRLLSIPESVPIPMSEEGNGSGKKIFALWQKIMQDAKTLKNGSQCSPQDVKQLVYNLENMSTIVGVKPDQMSVSSPRLRARVSSENTDTSLVAYNKGANMRSLNLQETQKNASFLLCPKPYGSMANQNEPTEQKEMNVLMFDDVKVNRDLVLFMPSTSIGGKQTPGKSWDGQWVQVNAVVKNIRTAHGFGKMGAIASL